VTSARWAELNNILEEKLISKIYFWQKKSNSPDRGCDIEAKFFGKKLFHLDTFCSFYSGAVQKASFSLLSKSFEIFAI